MDYIFSWSCTSGSVLLNPSNKFFDNTDSLDVQQRALVIDQLLACAEVNFRTICDLSRYRWIFHRPCRSPPWSTCHRNGDRADLDHSDPVLFMRGRIKYEQVRKKSAAAASGRDGPGRNRGLCRSRENLCHHLRIAEQRQFAVVFELRCFLVSSSYIVHLLPGLCGTQNGIVSPHLAKYGRTNSGQSSS